MNRRTLLNRILSGHSDTNIPFQVGASDRSPLPAGVVEQINLQPCGGKVVAYQVGQIRQVLINYNLKE